GNVDASVTLLKSRKGVVPLYRLKCLGVQDISTPRSSLRWFRSIYFKIFIAFLAIIIIYWLKKRSEVDSRVHAGLPPQSPFFIPRDEAMNKLVDGLLGKDKGKRQCRMVLSGMGGSGKSQLAVWFAEKHHQEFKIMVFIDASSPATILAGFISRMSKIDERFKWMNITEIMNSLADPHNEISSNWLIILDNADDSHIPLREFIPRCDHGSVLITTRNPSFASLAPQNHHSLNTMMTTDEAISALRYSAFGPEKRFTAEEHVEALEIVNTVGRLPIAIIQAGLYIKENLCFDGFSKRLKEAPAHVFEYPTQQLDGLRYPHGVYAAFDFALAALSQEAIKLLRILSFLHYSDFPRAVFDFARSSDFNYETWNLLKRTSQHQEVTHLLKTVLCPTGRCLTVEAEQPLSELVSYSFVTLVKIHKTVTLRFHPLLHEWANYRIPVEERPIFQAAAVRLLVCATSYDAEGIWPYLSPHVDALWPSMSQLHVNDQASLARIYRDNNNLHRYKQICENILERLEQCFDKTDLRVTETQMLVGSASGYINDIKKMERMETEALALRNVTQGPEALETVQFLGNNAHSTNYYMLNHEVALNMWNEVLRIHRIRLSPHSFLLSSTLYYTGQTHMFRGHYRAAIPLLEEALEIRRTEPPRTYHHTVNVMEALAHCYGLIGGLDQFKVLDRQRAILNLRQKEERHSLPDIWYAMQYLAMSLIQKGQYYEAANLLKEVSDGRRSIYGVQDPRTLASLSLLGYALYKQRRYGPTSKVWQEALDGFQKACNSTDAELSEYSHYSSWGFIPVKVRWRELLEEKREPRHIKAFNLMQNLGLTLFYQGEYVRAISLLRKVLDAKQQPFGEHHPDVVVIRRHIEMAVRAQDSLLYRVALFLRGLWFEPEPPSRCPLFEDCPARLEVVGTLSIVPPSYSLLPIERLCQIL
ncbi:hypothetical protein M408DRAFT_321401, partial [Serendipita vermifera MAFF 305830]